jgi:hypothetical protein
LVNRFVDVFKEPARSDINYLIMNRFVFFVI